MSTNLKLEWGVKLPDGSWLGQKPLKGWSIQKPYKPIAYSRYWAGRKARAYGDGAKVEKLPVEFCVDGRIARLRSLDDEAEQLRQQLDISGKGEATFEADLNSVDDERVIVEADGYGGATLSIIEGNYPVDYLTLHSRECKTEREAGELAEKIVDNEIDVDEAFPEPFPKIANPQPSR